MATSGQAHSSHVEEAIAYQFIAVLALTCLPAASAAQPAEMKLARPTAEPAARQDLEPGLFIRYDMPVFKPGWNHRHCKAGLPPGLYAHMGHNGYLEVNKPGLVNRSKGGDAATPASYAKICEGVPDPDKSGPEMLPILHWLQPKATVFQGAVASSRWIGNKDGVFNSLVDDVQIYNRALPAQEFAALAGGPDHAVDPAQQIDRATLDTWSAPYRGWHYGPGHVIPDRPSILGSESFHSTDVPCVYQLPGKADQWFMSFIAFNGQGYNSFVAESTNLVQWTNPQLAMGFGPPNEFDYGGCVIGAFLYESYDIKAPRLLKKRDGKYWTLYGCYPRQGGYELRPGYEGVAVSDDGLSWRRAKNAPILAVQDSDCGAWERDCIYQPWLVEDRGRFYNFYNAANGGTEQMGGATWLAFSTGARRRRPRRE